MADREMWAQRVAEWKASGMSSPAFCAGKEFTAGGLRYWASRLSQGDRPRPRVRVARVVRVGRVGTARADDQGAEVYVEIGPARITVRPGFDRETVAALIEVLVAARGTR